MVKVSVRKCQYNALSRNEISVSCECWFPSFVDKANFPIHIARIQLKYHTGRIKVRLLWLVLTGFKCINFQVCQSWCIRE